MFRLSASWTRTAISLRRLRQTGWSQPFEGWPCYHTELDTFLLGAHEVGIVGRVVGASFAVLVAEELFASGCPYW